jgi:hypothetical protein
MLKTVRDTRKPHRKALDFPFAEQIEDLVDLIARARDGGAFFEKTHLPASGGQVVEMDHRGPR